MSLYNMVLGHHPVAGELLTVLGYDRETTKEIPRFRDVYLFPNELRLLTRTGGGNRDDYIPENQLLRQREGFLRDWDDDFDSTFAWWAYEWPDDSQTKTMLREMLEAIQEHRPDLLPDTLEARFDDAAKNLK